MAKSGDWGGDKSAIPRTVKRTENVTKNATSTVSKPSLEVPEEAPKLRYVPDPWYTREPMNPAFKKNPRVPRGG
jgi:hypothetical protein